MWMTPVESRQVKLRVPEKLRRTFYDRTMLHSRSGGATLRGIVEDEAQSVWVLENEQHRYWIHHRDQPRLQELATMEDEQSAEVRATFYAVKVQTGRLKYNGPPWVARVSFMRSGPLQSCIAAIESGEVWAVREPVGDPSEFVVPDEQNANRIVEPRIPPRERPTHPYYVAIPVRGVSVPESPATEDLLARSWSLVGHQHVNAVAGLTTRPDSLRSNLENLIAEQDPTAFLLVRCHPREDEEAKVDTVVAAIGMALLLMHPHSDGSNTALQPIVCYRSRFRGLADLRLTFDADGVRQVGHSDRLGIVSGQGPATDGAGISIPLLEQQLKRCPRVVARAAAGAGLAGRELRLVVAMRALMAAFETTSPGAFVAAVVTALDPLLGSNDEGPTQWRHKMSRLKLLVGPGAVTTVDRVIGARHEFTHEAKQPQGDALCCSALAVAVQAWSVLAKLYERTQHIQDVIRYLDCCQLASMTTSNELASLRNECDHIPPGPVVRLHWVRRCLLGLTTSDYSTTHVVDGRGVCPSCAHIWSGDLSGQITDRVVHLACANCSHEWDATVLTSELPN